MFIIHIKCGDQVILYDNMTKYEVNRIDYIDHATWDYNWRYLQHIGVQMMKEDVCDYHTLMSMPQVDY